MKKKLIFYKGGRLRFVGHLDMMRTMLRALRRAQIPVAYSQGFNPHPHMSFANPLPLGCEGADEIMEMLLEKDMGDEEVLERFNAQLPEGLFIKAVRTIDDHETAIMAKVKAADYTIALPDLEAGGHETESVQRSGQAPSSSMACSWQSILEKEMARTEILSEKMGKVKGRKQLITVNIRPLIYAYSLEEGNRLHLCCACGSEENLKTDLLVKDLYQMAGHPELEHRERTCRQSLYSRQQDQWVNESDYHGWPAVAAEADAYDFGHKDEFF